MDLSNVVVRAGTRDTRKIPAACLCAEGAQDSCLAAVEYKKRGYAATKADEGTSRQTDAWLQTAGMDKSWSVRDGVRGETPLRTAREGLGKFREIMSEARWRASSGAQKITGGGRQREREPECCTFHRDSPSCAFRCMRRGDASPHYSQQTRSNISRQRYRRGAR
ncbi:hypothetical protein C8R43DRAFT_1039905 [Mycena crocata]|nr:hypothetical protein C8R43DRAFT_1039905 [Mycena crocata]